MSDIPQWQRIRERWAAVMPFGHYEGIVDVKYLCEKLELATKALEEITEIGYPSVNEIAFATLERLK